MVLRPRRGATVAALQDLKEKLADHMDHEEGEIFPLLAEIPEDEPRPRERGKAVYAPQMQGTQVR